MKPEDENGLTGPVTPEDSSTGDGLPAEEPAHHDDGLDLARALARASAKAGPPAGKGRKRRQPPASGTPRRGRSRASGSHPDDRDPQTLDATLGRLVSDHGWGLDLRVHGVFGRWEELVGADVAQHCIPESFADGKLLVRTDSTAWATQLKLLAPTVVRRLNEELGHGTVTIIEVLGPHLPTWKKGLRTSRDGRGPRDTYG